MTVALDRVVIGMDPHKRSATIEVMAGDERIVGGGRFGTDRSGYAAMRKYARQWPTRVWAIEGCQGIGWHIANRLLGVMPTLRRNWREAKSGSPQPTSRAIRAIGASVVRRRP